MNPSDAMTRGELVKDRLLSLTEAKRREAIVAALAELYPEPRSELHFSDPFQLLVSVVLSAQCTDKKVNEVTPSLFRKYPAPRELAAARLSTLEGIIRPINYYRTKARSLKGAARIVVDRFNGEIPRTRCDLLALPGVGNKTANVILGELGIEPSFPVDTHVYRVARRLALSAGERVEDVERDLRAAFDPALWRPLHHQLIFHGRRVCKALRPRCGECALNRWCPSRVENQSSRGPGAKASPK